MELLYPLLLCLTWLRRMKMNIRGWMEMDSTPYDLFSWNRHGINIYIINDLYCLICWRRIFNNAHSGHAGSSLSCLALPSFFLLLHVASFLAGARLLDLLLVWGAWPSIPPFFGADPISLRSQAMPYSRIGHSYCPGDVSWLVSTDD